jgi:hypothetical protein
VEALISDRFSEKGLHFVYMCYNLCNNLHSQIFGVPNMNMRRTVFAIVIFVFLCALPAAAQTTEFTYQGSLKSGNNPANGSFDFVFVLFDAQSNGTQIGSVSKTAQVTDGVFTVQLDFGNVFNGAPRYLEINVRSAGQGEFTRLDPRQFVNSAPQSVRSLTAGNALQLNGVAANQFVTTNDSRLVDPRTPTPGSLLYVQTGQTRQTFSAFNVDKGIADTFNALNDFQLLGKTLIHGGQKGNIYFGYNSGLSANGAEFNSFFGEDSGRGITMGDFNSFFGNGSGKATALGSFNSFYGASSGIANTGDSNSFFGYQSGLANISGTGNAYFGANSGIANTTGNNNTILGASADVSAPDLTFATAVGSGARVGNSNSVVLGRSQDTVRVPGALTVTGAGSVAGPLTVNGASTFTGNLTVNGTLSATGFSIPASSITGVVQAANGGTGLSNPGTSGNFLRSTGTGWTSTGLTLADIPAGSGSYIQNTTSQQGSSNFNISGNGTAAGTLAAGTVNATTQFNLSGNRILVGDLTNLIVGRGAGASNSGSSNTFVGVSAGAANTTPGGNSFFGTNSGINVNASNNSFFGVATGNQTTFGTGNSFFGANAGTNNTVGINNTLVGSGANVGTGGLSNATAIGAGAVVNNSNSVVLGTGADTVRVPGALAVTGNTSIGGTLNVTGGISGSFTVPATNITGTLGTGNGGTNVSASGPAGNVLRSNGTNWATSPLQASDIPSLAGNYIQNGTAQQAGSFNINGNGTVGGNFTVGGTLSATIPVGNLAGVIGAASGGTGLSNPGTSGNFLRSTGAGWTSAGLTPADIPSLGGTYIQNSTTTQASSNFNISGNGTVGGTLSGNIVNATTQFNLNGSRFLADANNNLFVGLSAGTDTTGARNTMVGTSAGVNTSTGDDNVFVGRNAGFINTTGSSNTILGTSANLSANNLVFATALGANAVATANDTIVIGKVAGTYNGGARPADSVIVRGTLSVGTLGTSGGMNNVCLDASNRISLCSSSARYKYNVNSFDSGLNLVKRLRPVSFNWKSNNAADMGLVAEEVAAVEPLLVQRNANGEVEGVKYDRIGIVLLNAVKEQQAQIESLQKEVENRKATEASLKERIDKQQAEIDAIKKLVCSHNPGAAICQ